MAKVDECSLSCEVCGRLCNGTSFGRQTHRFDGCGTIRAHVPVKDRAGEPTWVRNGMEGGYLTGLSTTTRRPR
jgi:hypothetical protein